MSINKFQPENNDPKKTFKQVNIPEPKLPNPRKPIKKDKPIPKEKI